MILPHPRGVATMLGFYEKRRILHFLYSRYMLAFMCIPVGLLSVAAYNAHERERESHAHNVALEEELATLEQRATALGADIERLNDPYGIEVELRKRYDVGLEGEEAIILVEPQEDGSRTQAVPAPSPGMWDRVKGWF